MAQDNRIVYIYSESLRKQCDKLPTMLNRATIVHDLITSYRLLSSKKVVVVESVDATEDELKLFHSSSYVKFLKRVNERDELDESEDDDEEFGLGYDCPVLPKMFDLVKTLAGGSLTAAKLLAGRKCDYAINWFGGWHHAQRDSASGFCYVNDIVLAIHVLTKSFKRVWYIDLDIHHGDGVQNAFEFSKNILTLSFHKLMPCFYPGTGRLEDVGSGRGKYYSINVPFMEGVCDESFLAVFAAVFALVFKAFRPEVFVVQCGADGLNGDAVGESNLTLNSFGECISTIMGCKIPALICGGGGYNFENTARLWGYLTSIIVGEELDDDIPDTSQFFTNYQPTYELHVEKGNQKDYNAEGYIADLISTVKSYCDFIRNDHD